MASCIAAMLGSNNVATSDLNSQGLILIAGGKDGDQPFQLELTRFDAHRLILVSPSPEFDERALISVFEYQFCGLIKALRDLVNVVWRAVA